MNQMEEIEKDFKSKEELARTNYNQALDDLKKIFDVCLACPLKDEENEPCKQDGRLKKKCMTDDIYMSYSQVHSEIDKLYKKQEVDNV